ncbi:S8 family serine peptidase [Dokdonella sp. MW10]|uniref:S8 family serine peptidase n=1 Tax=Dokdonella sp. MW10 TaxID=2992926 RepID=UPI003F80A7DD
MRRMSLLAAAVAASLSFAHAAEIEKIVLPAGVQAPAGYERIADYGSYSLYRGHPAAMPRGVQGAYALTEADVLQFDRLRLDTQQSTIEAPRGFTLVAPIGKTLQIVQFVGPLKPEWLDEVSATGAMPIHYIESNGYLVWADAAARDALGRMADAKSVLQFSQPLPSFVKLGDSLFERLQRAESGTTRVPVLIQIVRHADTEATRKRLEELGIHPKSPWTPVLGYENAVYEATLDQVRRIIEFPDVFWIGEEHPRSLNDEVQAQIIRGYFNANQSGPQAEGYLPWLDALGFPNTASSYPVVDITDDGVGNRTTETGDPTLHELGVAGSPSRVVFNQTCGSAALNGVVGGHGHINANIALGYDLRANATTPGARFPNEYQRGLGMNPYGRIASTRIFNSSGSFDQSTCGGSDIGVIRASYVAGARISSNSWGCSGCASQYNASSQAYDVGTRDADAQTTGNQQLITIFAAGNSGSSAGTVGTPGNGKNMLTVGASENQRPVDENGNWTDGCGTGPTGADNAMDVIGFSSRGPSPGQRVKPEVIAPGTHVTGTRANPTAGNSTCDAARPLGNLTYAASSGTSHSTPAVSGVASLAYWWIANGRGALAFDGGSPAVPSPALMKAWMTAHPTYLTGVSANDTLPSNVQGYGMPNLEDMFSETPKFVLDQTRVFGQSGEVYTFQGAVADPSRPLRITLAYTDAAGAVGTSPQVNNLDLEVDVAGATYLGNRFTGRWSTTGGTPDTRNNYEAVFLPAGTGDSITIRVKAFNIAGDGVPGNADTTDQDFALVCNNCAQTPSFTMQVEPPANVSVCSSTTPSVQYAMQFGSILGFTTPVTLSAVGQPAGTTTAFSTNPVGLPGSSTFTLGNLAAAAAGTHTVTITGTAGTETKARDVGVTVFNANPATFTLTAPADGAGSVALSPVLSWAAATQAAQYTVEIATDAAFANIVYTGTSSTTTHTVGTALSSSLRYYWRVRAANSCGETMSSATYTFTTLPLPGDCPLGTTPNAVYTTDFENDNSGWTSTAGEGSALWAISGTRTHSGTKAFLGQDVIVRSDQRLVSPAIALPSGQLPMNLLFWNHQTLEDRTGGCYDGVLLEVSSNDGTTWTQVPASQLLVGPYQGPIGTNNPITGLQAWCGDPQDWTRYVVDLASYAGQTVRFRWRLGTDGSVGRMPDGFYLDDVSVQTCTAAPTQDLIFADGFEASTP